MPISFRTVFINFSIVSLLVFAAISFIVGMQTENDSNSSILENSIINNTFTTLESNIGSQETSSNQSKSAFEGEVPAPGFGSLIIFAIVGVAQTFTSVITTTYNVLIALPISLLGVPFQVAQIIGSILMMVLIFLAWRVYRVGS